VLKGFRSGGVFPFIKFKKSIHPIVDSVEDESTMDLLSELLKGIRLRDLNKGIIFSAININLANINLAK